MKATRSPAAALAAALLCATVLAIGGCRDDAEEMTTVSFHAEGVRLNLRRVRAEIARASAPPGQGPTSQRSNGNYYAMRTACDKLARALGGLPDRVTNKADSRGEQRRAAAERAVQLFEALRPTLESMRYDPAEAGAKLDELARLIDEVERS